MTERRRCVSCGRPKLPRFFVGRSKTCRRCVEDNFERRILSTRSDYARWLCKVVDDVGFDQGLIRGPVRYPIAPWAQDLAGTVWTPEDDAWREFVLWWTNDRASG